MDALQTVKSPSSWVPCSGLEEVDGLVWFPRMLQKARRFALGRAQGVDLMGEYMFGDNDAIDRPVLDFLKTNDAAVLDVVQAYPGDAAAANALIQRSGTSLEERRAFSASLRRKFFNFAMIEADEARMPPGLQRTFWLFVYQRVVMPIFAPVFRRAEARRPDRP